MHEQHAVFATTTDGRRVRLTGWSSYFDAVDTWTLVGVHRMYQQRWFTRVPGTEARHAEIKHLEVRSKDDPRYTDAPRTTYGIDILTPRGYVDDTAVGRAIGRRHGYRGRGGGWIEDQHGTLVCQGWASLAHTAGGVHYLDGKYHGVTHLNMGGGRVSARGYGAPRGSAVRGPA